MFHWVFSSIHRKWVISGVTVLLLVVLGSFWIRMQHKASDMVEVAQSQPAIPLSYKVMQIAQDQVRALKPPPTEAALYYAYVASVYADALQQGDQSTAVSAAGAMMNTFYPSKTSVVNTAMASIRKEYLLESTVPKQAVVDSVTNEYAKRYANDGHDLKWDGVIPAGVGKWHKERPADPFTPRAGDWKRWLVTVPIAVPAPPAVGSKEDMQQLQTVKQVSSTRNGQDVNIINFWGGVPGTEAPAGIWQNQLYRTVKDELPSDAHTADIRYAATQKVLAQTLSDAFMECWKVKYTYWTARPDMRDTSIDTAMDNPNFPSYVSGHSTISKAAADVLGVMVPKHASEWQAMAVEARDSRLKAGIHFDIDNQVGFQLGTDVAKQITSSLHLQAQL
jgi:hypothetical protein